MLIPGMEGMNAQHATGYTCHMCGGVAVGDIGDGYLCAAHAIEEMMAITIDLRAGEPIVAVSTG
jgi:hypothetical protein